MELKGAILSIETSGSLCGASLYVEDNKYFTVNLHQKNIHAEKLFEAIDLVMKEGELQLKDISAVAVSAGPGSFTGLRIGMSAVKGLAFGADLPVVPVPTFEALALQIASYLPDKTEFAIANRVNNEEIYYAQFKISGNSYIFAEDLRIIHIDELLNLSGSKLIFGNAASTYDLSNVKAAIVNPDPFYVAKWCRLYGSSNIMYDYDYLEPNYLKEFIIRERKNV